MLDGIVVVASFECGCVHGGVVGVMKSPSWNLKRRY
jgi:hypothetical protein